MTKSKEKSYIVSKTGKLVLEVENRKKARRIARKKYSKEYKESKEYVIVSGSSLKEALSSLKKEIANRTEKKIKTSSKKQASNKKNPAAKNKSKKQAKSKKKLVSVKMSKPSKTKTAKPVVLENNIF